MYEKYKGQDTGGFEGKKEACGSGADRQAMGQIVQGSKVEP